MKIKESYLEMTVGLFLILGVASLIFLSVKVARKEVFNSRGYEVRAVFSNCNGLRTGSSVMIAGVEVGRVKKITLQEYEARVVMMIRPDIRLTKDSIASIKTKGLIGEKFIEILPGGDEETVPPGGVIRDTESAMDLEGVISKFLHGNINKPADP